MNHLTMGAYFPHNLYSLCLVPPEKPPIIMWDWGDYRGLQLTVAECKSLLRRREVGSSLSGMELLRVGTIHNCCVSCLWWVNDGLHMFTIYTDDTIYPPGKLYFLTVAWFVVLSHQVSSYGNSWWGRWDPHESYISIHLANDDMCQSKSLNGKIPNIDAH